jgi:hypothetical protein
MHTDPPASVPRFDGWVQGQKGSRIAVGGDGSKFYDTAAFVQEGHTIEVAAALAAAGRR